MEQGDYRKCKEFIDQKNPSVLLNKVIELLLYQASESYKSRQLKLLDQYLTLSHYGIFLRDIKNLMILLNLLITQKNSHEIRRRLLHIINLCSLPPLLIKSRDILIYSKDLQDYFNMLGYLLVDFDTDSECQSITAHTILELITHDYPCLKCYTPLTFRFQAAESGTFPVVLGEFLSVAGEQIYPILLKIVYQLTQNSEESCRKILRQQALSSIFQRLNSNWKQDCFGEKDEMPPVEHLIVNYEDTSKLAWRLLKYLSDHEFVGKPEIIPTTSALRKGLQYAFRYFCLKKNKALDRNNVLAIIMKCMEIFPDMLKNNANLAYDIAMLMVLGDVDFGQNHWAKRIKLKPNEDDYSFVAMLMMAMYYFDQFFSGIRILEECRVLHSLISLIKHNQCIQWHQSQYCSLLSLTLSLLKKIVPRLSEEFLEFGGTCCFLQIIKKSLKKGTDIKILVICLEAIDYLSKRSPIIRESFKFNDGIFAILALCEEILNEPILDSKLQTCLWHAVNLLHQICNFATDAVNTIPFIVKYMKRIIKPKNSDPVVDPRVTIVVINYLWENGIKYNKCIKLFLKLEGVFVLLDLIEKSCHPVRLVALGVLVDLCEDGRCIPYVITWRKNGKKIIPLLMEIFRNSNKHHGVRYGSEGEIIDVNYPIMGADQFYETYCTCEGKCCTSETGTPSMINMIGNCQPKVYAILQMILYRHKEQVEIANESYALFNDELSVHDKVTLLVAENYLTLKLGEAWREVKFGFECMGLEPVACDKLVIDTLIEKSVQWGTILRNMQFEVLRGEYEKDMYTEHDLYQKLKNPHLIEALAGIKEMKYISRCVERMFRISTSLQQTNQATKSMMQYQRNNVTLHKTYLSNLSVTPVFNQTIDIYEDARDTKSRQSMFNFEYMKTVSPEDSTDSLYYNFAESQENILEEPQMSLKCLKDCENLKD